MGQSEPSADAWRSGARVVASVGVVSPLKSSICLASDASILTWLGSNDRLCHAGGAGRCAIDNWLASALALGAVIVRGLEPALYQLSRCALLWLSHAKITVGHSVEAAAAGRTLAASGSIDRERAGRLILTLSAAAPRRLRAAPAMGSLQRCGSPHS